MNIIYKIVDGKPQLFAEFDFGIISGLMQFEKLNLAMKSEPEFVKGKRESNSDEDNKSWFRKKKKKTDKSTDQHTFFHLGARDMPTFPRPIWRYRWRGRDTTTEYIQYDANEYTDIITFDKGSKISGFFKCKFHERCVFMGVQTSTRAPADASGPQKSRGRD